MRPTDKTLNPDNHYVGERTLVQRPEAAEDARTFITARVPGIKSDFFSDGQRSLDDLLSHSQRQTLMFACAQLDPGLARGGFEAGATVDDLLYWLERVLESGLAPTLIPRGSYRSTTVMLRAIEEPDVVALYRASLDPATNHRWRFRGRTPAPEQFRQALFSEQVLAQYMVALVESHESTVGVVSAYAGDLVSKFCYVAFQRVGRFDQTEVQETGGLMIEGALLFVQYLFDHFDLRKLYLEVPEYNRSLFPLEGGLLVEEGRLADHLWYGDRYWDQYLFAIRRADWDVLATSYLGSWPPEHFAKVEAKP